VPGVEAPAAAEAAAPAAEPSSEAVAEGSDEHLASLLLTLARLTCSNKICEELVALGALDLCLATLRARAAAPVVARPLLSLLSALAGNDEVKDALCAAGCPAVVAAAMEVPGAPAPVVDGAAQLVAAITTRHAGNCEAFAAAGGPGAVVHAMRAHPDHVGIHKKAALCLRNLAVRHEESRAVILKHGAEEILRADMDRRGPGTRDLHDLAKAALRDLRCDVSLAQPWQGMPGEARTLESGDPEAENTFEQYMGTEEAREALAAAGLDTSQLG